MICDMRLVHTFEHAERFGSLWPVLLTVTMALDGPDGSALVTAHGGDDDFQYVFCAKLRLNGLGVGGTRTASIVSAVCERSWMDIEYLDPCSFWPARAALIAQFGICIQQDSLPKHAHGIDIHPSELLRLCMFRRQAITTIQRTVRSWRTRRARYTLGSLAKTSSRSSGGFGVLMDIS